MTQKELNSITEFCQTVADLSREGTELKVQSGYLINQLMWYLGAAWRDKNGTLKEVIIKWEDVG